MVSRVSIRYNTFIPGPQRIGESKDVSGEILSGLPFQNISKLFPVEHRLKSRIKLDGLLN